VRDQGLFVPLSLPFFGRRDDFVGQVGRGALWVRRIVNPPAGSDHNAGEWPEKFAACRYAGQSILPAAAPKSRLKAGCTIENPIEVGRTPWSAAGPPASPPRFVENSTNTRVFITFGGAQGHADSQDWLPRNSGN
jgi:hypothetical protein